MTTDSIKEYLSMALDMEKNLYIQENVISKLDNEIDSLGYSRKYEYPEKRTAYGSYTGPIVGTAMILGIVAFFIKMIIGFESSIGIFDSLSAPFQAIKPAIIWAIIGGVIGLIFALIKKTAKQSEYNQEHELQVQKYQALVNSDNERVKQENYRKQSLIKQRVELYEKYEESCEKLEELYNYNIIDPQYRNFVAVASISQYFNQKRTFSLGFNPETGDQGAYNLYNNERRQDIIIDKLDVIADKLDMVMENQQLIASTLQDANRRIDALNSNINRGIRRMESAINNQTAVMQYNAERQLAEQRYLNTLATWSYIERQ